MCKRHSYVAKVCEQWSGGGHRRVRRQHRLITSWSTARTGYVRPRPAQSLQEQPQAALHARKRGTPLECSLAVRLPSSSSFSARGAVAAICSARFPTSSRVCGLIEQELASPVRQPYNANQREIAACARKRDCFGQRSYWPRTPANPTTICLHIIALLRNVLPDDLPHRSGQGFCTTAGPHVHGLLFHLQPPLKHKYTTLAAVV